MAQEDRPAKSDMKQAQLLEENIENLEKMLADKYYQLGRGIYEAADRKIDEINRLVDRLIENKIQLTQARGQVSCPYCLTLNSKEDKFCGNCGKQLDFDEQDL